MALVLRPNARRVIRKESPSIFLLAKKYSWNFIVESISLIYNIRFTIWGVMSRPRSALIGLYVEIIMIIDLATLRHGLCLTSVRSRSVMHGRGKAMEEKLVSLVVAMVCALAILTGFISYAGWCYWCPPHPKMKAFGLLSEPLLWQQRHLAKS